MFIYIDFLNLYDWLNNLWVYKLGFVLTLRSTLTFETDVIASAYSII